MMINSSSSVTDGTLGATGLFDLAGIADEPSVGCLSAVSLAPGGAEFFPKVRVGTASEKRSIADSIRVEHLINCIPFDSAN